MYYYWNSTRFELCIQSLMVPLEVGWGIFKVMLKDWVRSPWALLYSKICVVQDLTVDFPLICHNLVNINWLKYLQFSPFESTVQFIWCFFMPINWR